VPQITAGPAFLAVAVAAGLLCDVHLMVARPSAQVDAFARAGADLLTIHAEAPDAAEAIAAVRAASARLNRPILAGLAIMPGTPLDSLAPLLALAPDLVLVLAVDPRDGSPADVGAAAARVRALRARVPVGTLIAIDGGITTRTIDTAAAAAPDMIVSGSAIFAADDPAQALGRLTDGWTAGQVFASTDRAGGGT
jgi:ribulose-phosphate 3-epimerase